MCVNNFSSCLSFFMEQDQYHRNSINGAANINNDILSCSCVQTCSAKVMPGLGARR